MAVATAMNGFPWRRTRIFNEGGLIASFANRIEYAIDLIFECDHLGSTLTTLTVRLSPSDIRIQSEDSRDKPSAEHVEEAQVGKAEHWENVYQTKSSAEVSWYEPDPTQSLDLIVGAAGTARGRVIDIGGGQSFLVDRLLDAGFAHIAVLDISQTAIDATKTRLGERASQVEWLVADITQCDALGEFDIWHDRAVFHFITDPDDRQRYLELLKRSLPIGGYFIVGTFAKGGPEKCSGLPIRQYDAAAMQEVLGDSFVPVSDCECLHTTPSGNQQQFFFGVYQRR